MEQLFLFTAKVKKYVKCSIILSFQAIQKALPATG